MLVGLSNIGSNIFYNGMIIGAAELFGDITALFLVKKVKRKPLLLFSVLLSSIIGVGHIFIGVDSSCNNGELNCLKSSVASVLAMIIKYVVTIGNALIFVYSTELLPTKIKATGLGICIFVGRAGSMIAPIIAEYSKVYGFH